MARPQIYFATVEECLRLEVRDLIAPGAPALRQRSGVLSWRSNMPGCPAASISIRSVHFVTEAPIAVLAYCAGDEPIEQMIRFVPTRLPYLGVRWWISCSIDRNGRACGSRRRMLYLPPGQRYFGCRDCHGITYQSCRNSHRDDAVFDLLSRFASRAAPPTSSAQ